MHSLGKGSNGTAELEAIYGSLTVVLQTHIDEQTDGLPVHIFTDSIGEYVPFELAVAKYCFSRKNGIECIETCMS